ncbi:tyrosine-type recombinase/integrase [Streptomyces sp. NPDC014733]|uniref:tyrosine-type recombinase/integrase n=1 Tax=Streptomyces sp. NPDC014733 TaxID=3364885 RepID=UPI0036F523A6
MVSGCWATQGWTAEQHPSHSRLPIDPRSSSPHEPASYSCGPAKCATTPCWRTTPSVRPLLGTPPPPSSARTILDGEGLAGAAALIRASWDRTIKRLELSAYTPHDLRDKWATQTLTNGFALHEVSRWLGHRSIKVTADQYGHLTQDGRERCRQVVTTTFQGHLPEEMSLHLTA